MRVLLAAVLFFIFGSVGNVGGAESWHDALGSRLQLQVEPLTVDGHPAFILLPEESKRSRERQPWILYAPALPGYPEEHERWMHQQLVSSGVAVGGIDLGECYGSPRGREGLSALYNELVEKRGFAAKPCLLARSRGGLWVLSWAGHNPEKVAGIAGIYPAFDLRTYPGMEKAAPAFELTAEQLNDDLKQHNPIEQADRLAKSRVPAYFIHGAPDEVVPLRENSAEFVARYEAAGVKDLVTVNVIKDQGHNFWPGFFQDPKLVEFAVARAKAAAAEGKSTGGGTSR